VSLSDVVAPHKKGVERLSLLNRQDVVNTSVLDTDTTLNGGESHLLGVTTSVRCDESSHRHTAKEHKRKKPLLRGRQSPKVGEQHNNKYKVQNNNQHTQQQCKNPQLRG